MRNDKILYARIPQALFAEIEGKASELECSIAEVVRSALDYYFETVEEATQIRRRNGE